MEVAQQQNRTVYRMHPQKFALWLFIASIVMLFAALTSAYIVRQAEGNWLDYTLPAIFWFNTAIILLSSATMHGVYKAVQKDNLDTAKVFMFVTLGLGVAFLIGQYVSWSRLVDQQVFFVGNPGGSFLYVLTGVHGVHIVSAIVVLIVMVFKLFRYKVHSKNIAGLEMCATYWHFLGFLWIYLFLFLQFNH